MWAAIKRLGTHYNRIRVLSEIENRFDQAIAQHKKIITIIENKEVDQVESILREHIYRTNKGLKVSIITISPYINYFDFT